MIRISEVIRLVSLLALLAYAAGCGEKDPVSSDSHDDELSVEHVDGDGHSDDEHADGDDHTEEEHADG